MDMKLNGGKLKALRLERSWSQEKLAEVAGLNPRTVQRAESEGKASLKTRLQLAQSLRVLPSELDAIEDAAAEQQAAPTPVAGVPRGISGLLRGLKSSMSGTSVYYMAVLALVSVVYLASKPLYFSLSLANYSWTNIIIRGQPLHEIPAWWVMTLSLWAALSLPVLIWLYRKHHSLFVPYLLAFCAGLALAVLKSWQTMMVAELLTLLLFLSGLLLLLSLYIRWLDTAKIRHGVNMCLSAYLFVWFFQSFGLNAMLVFLGVSQFGREFPGLSSIFYILNPLFSNLVQLIPVALVLLLSLGRKDFGKGSGEDGPSPALPSLTRKKPAGEGKGNAASDSRQLSGAALSA